jgi:hypothetical protein
MPKSVASKRKRTNSASSTINSRPASKIKKNVAKETLGDDDNDADDDTNNDASNDDANEQPDAASEPTSLRRSTRANRNERPAYNIGQGAVYRAEVKRTAQAKKDEKTSKAVEKKSQKTSEKCKVDKGLKVIAGLIQDRATRDASVFKEDCAPASSAAADESDTDENMEAHTQDSDDGSVQDKHSNDEQEDESFQEPAEGEDSDAELHEEDEEDVAQDDNGETQKKDDEMQTESDSAESACSPKRRPRTLSRKPVSTQLFCISRFSSTDKMILRLGRRPLHARHCPRRRQQRSAKTLALPKQESKCSETDLSYRLRRLLQRRKITRKWLKQLSSRLKLTDILTFSIL